MYRIPKLRFGLTLALLLFDTILGIALPTDLPKIKILNITAGR